MLSIKFDTLLEVKWTVFSLQKYFIRKLQIGISRTLYRDIPIAVLQEMFIFAENRMRLGK